MSPFSIGADELTLSRRSRFSPLPIAIACVRERPAITATAAFRSISSCTWAAWKDSHDSPDRALRRQHRHVVSHAVGRPVDGHRPEVRVGARPDDLRRAHRHPAAVAQIEQPPQVLGLAGQGPLALDRHPEVADLLFQGEVVGVHVVQRRVLVPGPPHAAHHRRGPALELEKRAERLQQRHARPRGHLRGDQDDVPDREGQEQVAAPPPDIGDGHGANSGILRSWELAILRTESGKPRGRPD